MLDMAWAFFKKLRRRLFPTNIEVAEDVIQASLLKKLRRRFFPTNIELAEDAIQDAFLAIANIELELEKLRQAVALCDETDESRKFASLAKKIIALGEEQIATTRESLGMSNQRLRSLRAWRCL